jgi:cell division protein FtsB
LLEQQARTLDRQSEQITSLTGEVDGLKDGKSSSGAGDGNAELLEKIRRLELELEEARSA